MCWSRLYTVYDNKTDFVVAVSERAEECAKRMGIRMTSFYNIVERCINGTNKRWTIVKHDKTNAIMLDYSLLDKKIQPIIRVKKLADLLKTTPYLLKKFCKNNGIPILEVGDKKIRMVNTRQILSVIRSENG